MNLPRDLRHFEATVNGRPEPFARTGGTFTNPHTGKQVRVNPARYRSWKTSAANIFTGSARWRAFPEGQPVAVVVDVYADKVTVTVDALGTSRRPAIRGDLDNYAKAVLDALTASKVIDDDRQVHHLTALFHADPKPPTPRRPRRTQRSQP